MRATLVVTEPYKGVAQKQRLSRTTEVSHTKVSHTTGGKFVSQNKHEVSHSADANFVSHCISKVCLTLQKKSSSRTTVSKQGCPTLQLRNQSAK